MKRHDICVNGSMVKEGFAVSSGSESAVVERIKEVIKEVIPEEDDEGTVVVVRVACVGPIENYQTWSSSAFDTFKVTCDKFKRLSISLHGPSVHGAIPVTCHHEDDSATDKFYSDNEPCIAKFHQDNKFYRAIVRKAISCRRYKVQFIDYGNIEEVDIADLRKNVNCGRVPIQMNSYRLTNVAPKKATPGRRKSSTRCIH
ncbi:hypothetical protein quinque_002466 [Culex quinquefasciatus]